jgi:hypothetical protein
MVPTLGNLGRYRTRARPRLKRTWNAQGEKKYRTETLPHLKREEKKAQD